MTPAPQLIETERLTKIYQSGAVPLYALREVSLTIAHFSFVAIMGPSGSGKSTFMNIIGCLDRPTSGRYLLDGYDVGSLDRDRRAEIRNQRLGFVFQNFNLLPRTSALENVELPLLYNPERSGKRREIALRALSLVGLSEFGDHHPSQLSGGQQQRVAIARSLVNDPEIILADEPTGALDSRTGAEIMCVFQKLNRELGITLVVVTHDPDIARCAGRIIRFRDGRVVEDEKVSRPRDAEAEVAAAIEKAPEVAHL
jgi:putative ABC transport system ATP-binding protein